MNPINEKLMQGQPPEGHHPKMDVDSYIYKEKRCDQNDHPINTTPWFAAAPTISAKTISSKVNCADKSSNTWAVPHKLGGNRSPKDGSKTTA